MDLLSESPSLAEAHEEHAFAFRWLRRSVPPISIVAASVLPIGIIYLLHRITVLDARDLAAWERNSLVLYVIANLLVGLASVALAARLRHSQDKRHKTLSMLWPFLAVGLFCISNAATHAILAIADWKPEYWLGLSIQYVSGIAAIGLSVIVPPMAPSLGRLVRSAQRSDVHKNMVETTNAELLKANDSLRIEIGERKRAEDKERTNLQRVRGIIDNLPVGAIAFDEADCVLHANNLFCQLFDLGIEAQSLIGHHSTEFAGLLQKQIRNREEFDLHVRGLSAAKKTTLGTEIRFRDDRIIEQDYIPLFANDTYTGQLFLYRDITKEKRIDATKSEFMSLASHQLRTPLTTMRWSFGRLNRTLKDRLSITEERLLQEAKSAAGRMAHTIDTMLAISRVEAGKISLEVSEIKLGNTVNEVRTEVREEYEAKRQSFVIDCPPGVHVLTDQYVFKEVLRNLFTNAIKYTPEGGKIHARVSTLHQHVQIDISDTGYGIPTNQQQKIFSKFFRGDNIVQRDTEGTGLGLYLVFLLVKLLGATIFFVSEEGRGTTFTLLLPRQHVQRRSAEEVKTI